jgi:hypothetical protein
MPTTQVTSGDLITAALMNEILQRLATVEGNAGSGTSGTVVVPSVFGFTLSSARTLLSSPAQQLAPGVAVGTDGAIVDATLPANGTRMVLVQMPSAGTRVVPGSTVDMIVVAASAVPPVQPAAITAIVPSTAPIGSTIDVQGTGFAQLFSSNAVRFDGIAGTVLPGGNTTHLNVVVPAGIPNAPKNGVQVIVQPTGGSASTPFSLNVTAAVINKPTITTPLSPASGTAGQPITINGTNFGANPAANGVKFNGITASITAANSTSITATVPAGVVTNAPKFDVQLVVTNLTTGQSSNPFTLAVAP